MKIKYRPEIDGLRAIAVIAVIFYHAQFKLFGYDLFKGGFLGEDVYIGHHVARALEVDGHGAVHPVTNDASGTSRRPAGHVQGTVTTG